MRQNQSNVIVSLSDRLNKAIILFLGFGETFAPDRDASRLIRESGATEAALLEPKVQAIHDGLGTIQVDWSKHTHASAEQEVLAQMHARHPDLSEEALDALGWDFTFFWR